MGILSKAIFPLRKRTSLIVVLSGLWAFWFATTTAWEHNREVPASEWRSNLRADAAGYYVYLPGVFHHGMRAESWPAGTEALMGNGFLLDTISNKVITKYTCGVALLQLPFYLAAELLTGGSSLDGVTDIHRRSMETAAGFYWSMALVMLIWAFHQRWPGPMWAPITALALTALGSHVIFYVVRMPSYSHVFSFFTISAALAIAVADRSGLRAPYYRVAFQLACALTVLIRPIDIIAVAGLYGWLWLDHGRTILRPGLLFSQVLIAIAVAAPQLIYWQFIHGELLHYSYGNEGFSNWNKPEVGRFLFAPGNGWLPNAPTLILLPIGLWSMYPEYRKHAILIVLILVAVVYACSSWHVWTFGCSFGARPMVQYMPFVALTFHHFMIRKDLLGERLRFSLIPIAALLAFVTYRAALRFDVCYGWGEDNWRFFVRNLVHAFYGSGPL